VLQLTMAGEYTVRAMLHLASQPAGAVVQIYDIAQQWKIPETFLRKIVQLLTKANLGCRIAASAAALNWQNRRRTLRFWRLSSRRRKTGVEQMFNHSRRMFSRVVVRRAFGVA